MIKVFRYKLNLTKNQRLTFDQWLGGCRFLYNTAKECREWAYQSYGKSLNYYDLANELKYVKKLEGYEWIKEIPHHTLQHTLKRLESAYKDFFKGEKGYPKWAKKHKFSSFVIPLDQKVKDQRITHNRIKLPKIGSVKYYAHRELPCRPKNAIIKKEANDWYISFQCEVEHPIQYIPKAKNQSIGIDWGVKHFYTDSFGHHEPNPRFLDKYKKRMRVLQRSLSRKTKGSRNWINVKRQISKLHSKIARARKDWQHKLSYRIVRDNQIISVEKLNIKGITKRSKPKLSEDGKTYLPNKAKAKSGLNRSILDTAPNQFQTFLEYKSKWYQRTFCQPPAKNSSRECSECGHISKDNRKTQSTFSCVACFHRENADVNAAKNIEGRGLTSLDDNVEQFSSCVVLKAPTPLG